MGKKRAPGPRKRFLEKRYKVGTRFTEKERKALFDKAFSLGKSYQEWSAKVLKRAAGI